MDEAWDGCFSKYGLEVVFCFPTEAKKNNFQLVWLQTSISPIDIMKVIFTFWSFHLKKIRRRMKLINLFITEGRQKIVGITLLKWKIMARIVAAPYILNDKHLWQRAIWTKQRNKSSIYMDSFLIASYHLTCASFYYGFIAWEEMVIGKNN